MFKPYHILLSVLLFTTIKQTLAQPKVKLKDVAKFELITKGGGLSDTYRSIIVEPDTGGWRCYLTKFIGYDAKSKIKINSSKKVFIKMVPAGVLNQLLNIVSKPDTGINMKLFKIDRAKLTSSIDSLHINLKSTQKVEFVNAVKSKAIVKEALVRALHPMPMDDKTYYGITIITKSNDSIIVKAYSFASLYYLPWQINGVNSYNPNISLIFNFISANEQYAGQQNKWLHRNIDQNIYQYCLRKRWFVSQ